jgi:hypothetical protein
MMACFPAADEQVSELPPESLVHSLLHAQRAQPVFRRVVRDNVGSTAASAVTRPLDRRCGRVKLQVHTQLEP